MPWDLNRRIIFGGILAGVTLWCPAVFAQSKAEVVAYLFRDGLIKIENGGDGGHPLRGATFSE